MILYNIHEEYLQTLNEMGRAGSIYKNRKLMRLSNNLPILPDPTRQLWESVNWLFCQISLDVLQRFYQHRDTTADTAKTPEVLYVVDRPGYSLGPHTDIKTKLCTLLFYMPENNEVNIPGTSFYRPRDPTFTCPGTAHHESKDFIQTNSFDFVPNRLVAFFRSDKSFHGVEKMTVDTKRNLLICDVKKL